MLFIAFNILILFIILIVMNMGLNHVGFVFAEVEILSAGNENLLNNLTEGVVIMDKDDG